eukprot:gene21587-23023_t
MSSLKDGDRVQTPRHGLGTVKYIGSHQSKSGLWVGVELDDPVGPHDGTHDGRTYFSTDSNHGVLFPVLLASGENINSAAADRSVRRPRSAGRVPHSHSGGLEEGDWGGGDDGSRRGRGGGGGRSKAPLRIPYSAPQRRGFAPPSAAAAASAAMLSSSAVHYAAHTAAWGKGATVRNRHRDRESGAIAHAAAFTVHRTMGAGMAGMQHQHQHPQQAGGGASSYGASSYSESRAGTRGARTVERAWGGDRGMIHGTTASMGSRAPTHDHIGGGGGWGNDGTGRGRGTSGRWAAARWENEPSLPGETVLA